MYDEQLMGTLERLEKISLSTLSTHRRGCASLPSAMGGHAITSWSETRYSAHYASWHACYSNISKTFPAAISITPQQIEDPAACMCQTATRKLLLTAPKCTYTPTPPKA